MYSKNLKLVEKDLIDFNSKWLENNVKFQNIDGSITPNSVSLTPKILTKTNYENLKKMNLIYNKVLGLIFKKENLIIDILEKYTKNDVYIKKLIEIYKKLTNKKSKFLYLRNDFIFDENKKNFQQIEYNLIAVSVSLLTDNYTKTLQNAIESKDSSINIFKTNNEVKTHLNLIKIIKNKLDKEEHTALFILKTGEQNVYEIGGMKNIFMTSGFNVIIKNFDDVVSKYEMKNNELFIDNVKISVVYWRYGYDYQHYKTDKHFEFRFNSDNSSAINIPDTLSLLLNMKIFQSFIGNNKFLQNIGLPEEEINFILPYFSEIYRYDQFDNNKQKLIDFIEKIGYEKYVLKSNEEGGGDHFFKNQIKDALKTDDVILENYSLMNYIDSTILNSQIFNKNEILNLETISEIGIYSYLVLNENNEIEHNENGDYCLRTKQKDSFKAGVTLNLSSIDTIMLE